MSCPDRPRRADLVRSVLVAERHPWPADGGIALRNAANASALASLGPLTVVGVGDPAGDLTCSPLGESRAVGLGRPPRSDPDDRWAERRDGHPSDARWDEDADRVLRDVILRERPDLVVIEQLWLHLAIPAAKSGGARVVLDAHNVESDVYAAIAKADERSDATSSRPRRLSAEMAARTRTLEYRAVAAVDHVWACSPLDVEWFRRAGADVHLVPNGVDVDAVTARSVPSDEPLMVFPASFAYPPNVEAARVLIDEVLPAVRQRVAGAGVALVGRDPPRWLRKRALAGGGIEVTGAVPSVAPWLRRAGALVVPLAEGSGTRFKILEAMAAGVPVVSTPKGVEGLAVVHGQQVLIGCEPTDLADLVVTLWNSDATALTRSARTLVERRYSWSTVAAATAEAVRRHLALTTVQSW